MDEIFHTVELAVKDIRLVSGDLGHPVAVWVMRDSPKPHLPGRYILEEKDMLTDKSIWRKKLICGEIT